MAGEPGVMNEEVSSRRRPPIGRLHLLLIMIGLVVLGGMNFALLKVTYTAYGDRRSFFVNQAINLLYVVYGGAILYPRMLFTNVVTKEMTSFPKRPFFIMGTLDSLGTFLTCLGTAYTPGSITPLLNQLLIPFTMLVSAVWLKIRSRWQERCGAFFIVLGASISVIPKIVDVPDDSSALQNIAVQSRWYAILFYALSNFPMAASSCYKESTFENHHLDVWYLTQWVSIWQFLISFIYMPLLVLPGFSSKQGMSFAEVVDSFVDGWTCYSQQDPDCARGGAFLLLTGYCGVNVCFNTLGLYLTKHGSAVLNALSYSILLPFTTALFFTPLLGPYQEPLMRDAYFTFIGLVVTLFGFAIYQLYSQQVGESRRVPSTPLLSPTPACPPGSLLEEFLEPPETPSVCQPSFQERVVMAPVNPVRKNSGGLA